MVVLITDGRANISLGRSNEDPDSIGPDAPKPGADQLKEEVSEGQEGRWRARPLFPWPPY